MNRGKAERLRRAIVEGSKALPDETAVDAVELFPAWAVGVNSIVSKGITPYA